MFGWRAWASCSAWFQSCMLASDQAPSVSSVFTVTQRIGSSPMTASIRSIRAGRSTGPPTATFAVSVVPIASTQHPSYPVALIAAAASSALS